MNQESSNILVSIYRNAKTECLKHPIATASAVIGILGTGLAYLFRQYVIKAITKTEESNISLLILSLVSLIAAFIALRNTKQKFPKIQYFTIGNHKWKTKIFRDGSFEVEKYPFCITHDLRLIDRAIGLACPKAVDEDCRNSIAEFYIEDTYEVAKSIIENKIKNGECQQ